MSELYYPPNFGQWPPEARGEWYGINANKEEVLCEIRDEVGVDDGGNIQRMQKVDMAAVVEQLTDGERVLRVDNSRSACLTALVDEAGLDNISNGKLTTEQLGIVLSELQDRFPSSPHPIALLA